MQNAGLVFVANADKTFHEILTEGNGSVLY